ncbi:MAG: DinB family protein [Burkholderiales bacterium]|nr:DinB family protein [Anaerolineae bacterium]
MNIDYFRKLFDYNYWAHQRVWDCAMQLNDEQFTRPWDYSIGSVHQQIAHTIGAEWAWLQRMNGVSPETIPGAFDYPTRDIMRTTWDKVEAEWHSYLDALTDDDLNTTKTYISVTLREQRQNHLWLTLSHVINHSTDHRAQTLARVHQVGGPTIAQDLIFYSWEV